MAEKKPLKGLVPNTYLSNPTQRLLQREFMDSRQQHYHPQHFYRDSGSIVGGHEVMTTYKFNTPHNKHLVSII